MGKCLPGSPCYKGNDVTIYTTYPKGCTSSTYNPCTSFPIRSIDVYYSGPNLPYSGINTEMLLTEALQRIDTKLNPSVILTLIVELLDSDPDMKTLLCEALSDC